MPHPSPQRRASLRPLVACLLAGCAAPALPEGNGRGLIGYDRTPPDGVETFAAPRWQPGDRFVYLRGNCQQVKLHVVANGEGFALVDDAQPGRQLLSPDLADLGHEDTEPGDVHVTSIALAPADVRYHWPLWVGKRWSCHFLRKAPGHPPLPLLVTYVVEAAEDVTVPAGSFRALRILRRAAVAAEGTYLERATLTWYAPAIGSEVRRLDDGIVTELVEVHRQ